MKEEWRKQLQRKMADYEESDIDLSWENIEKALEANRRKALMADRQKARTILLWYRRIAAAAVVLLLTGVGYWMLQQNHGDRSHDIVQSPNQGSVPMTLSPKTSDHQYVPVTPRTLASAGIVPLHQSASSAPDFAEATDEEPSSANQMADETTDEKGESGKWKEESGKRTEDRVAGRSQPRPTVIYPSDFRKKRSSDSRLTARVYFSNAMTSYNSQFSSFHERLIPRENDDPALNPTTNTPTDNSPTTNTPTENGPTTNPPYNGGSGGNTDSPESSGDNDNPGFDFGSPETGDTSGGESAENNNDGDNTGQQCSKTRQGESQQYRTEQTNESIHHHQPVRFGLSLRYRLNDRWSIESGLTYTRLSADFTKTVDDNSVTTEQRLNYIGIPVSASYLLLGSRYLNVYLSAGAMVEKMVSGSRRTASETYSVSIHPLQFSLNGAVGAEFRFTPQFSLYAEPGFGYWFDNGSSIPTYYQDKPFSFSLSLGFRVSPW